MISCTFASKLWRTPGRVAASKPSKKKDSPVTAVHRLYTLSSDAVHASLEESTQKYSG